MKKLLCLLLVMILIPIVSFSDERDPIIGAWYMYYDITESPELADAYPGYDQISSVYFFNENGVVYASNTNIAGTTGETGYSSCGRWEKADYQYLVSIIGLGECKSYIENDCLYAEISDTGYYMRLHKMLPFNPYQDYIRK